ncbi:amino acid ABC transporter permease [Natronoglycomyces albus]|uniref:Amino acid ABC transporter permease n=1 Tax=Natronoglycomyces albus TaxID=2811108 RepID=A0A895XJM3_9ACTN|nr:amino acid ABC transporter permease [Natronoglycomyces albus]QSB05961.1 amino acid ABC transporter permease [Natronoglycomyces albus]
MDLLFRTIEALPTYLEPLGVTLLVTVLSLFGSLILAFVLGLATGSRFLSVRFVGRTIVEFFRGTSLVVQLFWIAFAMPVLLGFSFDWLILSGVLALSLNFGAYASEVVRGAIAAVPSGQYEASTAINLSYWQRMRLVIIPQAWPEMIPPMSTQAVHLLKSTSLVSMIGIVDLTARANTVGARPGQDLLFQYGIILVIYFILAWLLAAGMRQLEHRAKRNIGRAPVATKNTATAGAGVVN